MSAFKDVVDSIRDVLRMNDDLKRAAEGLKALAIDVRGHDRRLIRLETIVELATMQSGRPPPKRIAKKT